MLFYHNVFFYSTRRAGDYFVAANHGFQTLDKIVEYDILKYVVFKVLR